MTLRKQELTAGDDATVYQAARDIHKHGPSMTEMRQIALDVYRANALELRGIAEDTANARAERITNDYLTRLMNEHPVASQNLADPDVQSVMFEAQKAYARSGDEDLETVLVDLLTDRTTEVDRSLRTLVLNEAISSAPKLTAAQRNIIALVFLLRYTRPMATDVENFMLSYVANDVMVIGSATQSHHDYRQDIQHLEYVGVASSSLGEMHFGAGLMAGIEGLFTRGFTRESIPEKFRNSVHFDALFMPCERLPEHLQLTVLSDDDIQALVDKLGEPDWTAELKALSKEGRMQAHEVVAETAESQPEVKDLADVWANRGYGRLTLTSVGIAIGHSYWKRVTGATEPLSTWL